MIKLFRVACVSGYLSEINFDSLLTKNLLQQERYV